MFCKCCCEQPGEIVTREELQKRIWPADTFVDFGSGLDNAIKRLDLAEAVLPSVQVQRGKSASRSRHPHPEGSQAEYAKLK
jgi:DNA-binding response OmpR family regulator